VLDGAPRRAGAALTGRRPEANTTPAMPAPLMAADPRNSRPFIVAASTIFCRESAIAVK